MLIFLLHSLRCFLCDKIELENVVAYIPVKLNKKSLRRTSRNSNSFML